MPMEVMGLMLGDFVDDYTVKVVDVFAMPQSGTGVSVEAVDDEFQTAMLEMLKQTGRPEIVVGWYHSHPGFGCWLSSVDCNTQQSFEQLHPRAVAVVVDPIQSVKGKVVIDAFRLINPQAVLTGQVFCLICCSFSHLFLCSKLVKLLQTLDTFRSLQFRLLFTVSIALIIPWPSIIERTSLSKPC